ncbi:MAG: hypothetical protein AVDCRST_MAG23-1410, partial [uncultured Sphingosinicella sp.]
ASPCLRRADCSIARRSCDGAKGGSASRDGAGCGAARAGDRRHRQ